ncbi:ABC1 domain-containing protein [Haematococcus lacustris]|uniref:ABC1 domain-containing protein n=1 Tax=Haematococcus lacustris TaxID=44745 RepID=A0A6A0A647_HAELA|nr:ABC1 domain-containing protein [Haematococcus lacustris]
MAAAATPALRAQLVLLDFGLAEELSPRVRHHFISFLNCIAAGNGLRAAQHLLMWSTQQRCPAPLAFTRAMEELFAVHCNIHQAAGIDLDLVMKAVLRLACMHAVAIDSAYASLAVSVCVLVGLATAMDPQVTTPCMLAYSLTGQVVGRLYS